MHDRVEIECSDEKVIHIEVDGIEADTISVNPKRNSAGRTASAFLEEFDQCGFKIRITKGIPPGSGLGSSGASAAATAVAINHLLDLKLDKRQLTELAAQGEIASAGTAHADNVAPAIYGGFIIIHSYRPIEVLAFPPPREFEFALAVPRGIKKTTKRARDVLPTRVLIPKVISNLGAASVLVAGLLLSDEVLVGKGMLGDQIVEPARAHLYPGYLGAKKAALDNGALGATLSGAGPTVIAIVNREKANAGEIAKAMKEAFETEGIQCQGYVSRSTTGARICDPAFLS
jgi:homoserine kinase